MGAVVPGEKKSVCLYFIVHNYPVLEVWCLTKYETSLHLEQLLLTFLNFQESVCTEHV